MHLLLSNDDGIHASGLRLLAEALAPLGKITVVAPNRNRSAASNSLTLERPIRAPKLRLKVPAGTPRTPGDTTIKL